MVTGTRGSRMGGPLTVMIIQLAHEEYGIPISQVQEIIRVPKMTRVSGMPDFLKGVINLRGQVIPVLDLKERFGLGRTQAGGRGRIAVVQLGTQTLGILADSASEILHLEPEIVDVVPSVLSRLGSTSCLGVGKVGERLIILLNVAQLLSLFEKETLRAMEHDTQETTEPA